MVWCCISHTCKGLVADKYREHLTIISADNTYLHLWYWYYQHVTVVKCDHSFEHLVLSTIVICLCERVCFCVLPVCSSYL